MLDIYSKLGLSVLQESHTQCWQCFLLCFWHVPKV
ncbi:hypothetical protein ERO13_A10G092850v2 [Gossypium hirsutum]|uniref:Uncharacterized protein n=1 Tax=Gossypium darwinii TaxID=34276 RepID=A0A5D2EX59_GOSDA|nr:hypothetical protein ERO13_A10G092850v2 [Gossypium hirsutum]TYG98326.1 hypothetical protein ES288_A10G108700v1 [Gossypium darwinii]TYG98327.1 hypothetical protein ES288_A10G108700v1 [Gossypium darwinii]